MRARLPVRGPLRPADRGRAQLDRAAGRPSAGPSSAGPALAAPRSRRDRAVRAAIFATFPYPRRLRLLTGPLRLGQRTGLTRLVQRSRLAARFAPELAASLHIAPAPPGRSSATAAAAPASSSATHTTRRPATARTGRIPAEGPRRATVGLLTGCVQRVFFPGVNDATARVLAAAGCDVVIPARQGCCGALSLHTGRTAEAARFARRTIAVFEAADVDVIVVNSAGCGSAMKEYSHLLGTGSGGAVSKVRDLSEYLAELAGGSAGTGFSLQAFPVRAMYHEACHLGNAQGIRSQPRDLLRAIPGLELVESGDGGVCCGSAGVYNLLQPEAAGELGARKAAAVLATGADLVISANPGCSLQIASAMADAGAADAPRVVHIAEVLDASIRGLPVSALTGR